MTGTLAWVRNAVALIALVLGLAAAPGMARAQAPGGPLFDECPASGEVSLVFPARSGTLTDVEGNSCYSSPRLRGWRDRYTVTVTSTLTDATFRLESVLETGVDITAPGTYPILHHLPFISYMPPATYGRASLGSSIDFELAGPNVDVPLLARSYTVTPTGPNPAGTVTVTITGGISDIPGGLVRFISNEASSLTVASSGVLYQTQDVYARTDFAIVPVFARYVVEPGVGYTFTVPVQPSGRRFSALNCTGATPSIDWANSRFTLVGPADRQTASCAVTFAFSPSVSSLAPSAGPVGGGGTVTITGTGLSDVTSVSFGANPATFTISNATTLFATVPAGSLGVVDVVLRAGELVSANTAADDFTYAVPPAVTALSPATGPVAGGTVVTITGTDLTGVTAVRFGAFAATAFTVNSPTSLTATAPAGAAGTVDLIVRARGVNSANTAADNYTYANAPPPPPPPPLGIPTMSEWAMILLGVLLAGFAVTRLRTIG